MFNLMNKIGPLFSLYVIWFNVIQDPEELCALSRPSAAVHLHGVFLAKPRKRSVTSVGRVGVLKAVGSARGETQRLMAVSLV